MNRVLPRAVLGLYGIADRGAYLTPRWTHDHGLALIVDGRVEWALELERITRIKHDNRMASYIETLVTDGIVQLPDEFVLASVDSLVGRCFVSTTGHWRVEADQAPLGGSPIQQARGSLGTAALPAFVVSHEAAHVGASLPFFEDWDEDTILVHIDGGASQCNASAWRWRGGQLETMRHDWDTLWAILNFGHNDLALEILGLDEHRRMAAPGRLMGLAGYGTPRDDVRRWLEDHDWFRDHWQRPGDFEKRAKVEFGWSGLLSDSNDPFVRSIVAALQANFEDVVVDWVAAVLAEAGGSRLVLSGGAALNINTNAKLQQRFPPHRLQIPPCCNDSGLALGAASLTWRLLFGPMAELHSPFLQSVGLGSCPPGGEALDVAALSDRLAAGEIVAWFQNAAEVGPRALGHRSLLCIPTTEAKHRVSETIKRREWYRPVAPVILEELASSVFPGAERSALAPFMLASFPVAAAWQPRVPGVVHIDGTARAQIIGRGTSNALLRQLLEACWHRHGVPCLINTSFNGPGEPIVHRRDEALATAQRLGVDAIVIDDRFFPLQEASSGALP